MDSFSKQFADIIERKVIRTYNKLSKGKHAVEIGDYTVEQIQRRTRLGKGVATRLGPEGQFIDLSPKYVKQKKKDGFSGSKKARLIRTGEMLKSIMSKVRSKGRIFIEFRGTRDDGLTNSELASYHDQQGAGKSKVKRPFFNISAKDYSKISRFVRKKAREIIKRS